MGWVLVFWVQVGQPEIVQQLSVVATRTEKHISEVPASVTIVGPAEIAARAASGNLADVLRDVPGVELYDVSVPGAKRIGIRGEHGTRVLILIDGQRVSEQKSMDGSPLLISVSDIASIEVMRGPASVLYGSDALGGVVHIHTRSATQESLRGRVSLSHDGSANGNAGSLEVSGSRKNWQFRFAGNQTHFGNRQTPDGELAHSGYGSGSINARVSRDLESGHVSFGWETYKGTMESAPIEIAPPMTRFSIELPEWNREKAWFSWEMTPPNSALVRAQAHFYAQETYKEFVNQMAFQFAPNSPESTIDIQTDNQLATYGAQFQADLSIQNHVLTTGIEVFDDHLESREHQEQIGFGPPLVFNYRYVATSMQAAVFAHDEWTLSPQWVAFAGLRHTYHRYQLEETDNPQLAVADESSQRPVASLGLVYRREGLNLRFQAAQGYRIATLQQLFIGTTHGSSIPTLPNPELEPETSVNYDAGMRFHAGRTEIDFSAFYSRADHYIATELGETTRTYVNVERAQSFGSELGLRHGFNDRWSGFVSAAWLRRAFETQRQRTYQTGHPDLTGRLGLTWESIAIGHWNFTATASIRGAGNAEERLGEGVVETDAWMTSNLDVAANRQGRIPLQFNVALNNLADASYRVATETVSAPGRHVTAHLSLQF